MTYARKSLVSLNDTAYYHVVARCVRRAWLWRFDKYAGRDFSHRKQWMLERLRLLTAMFAIDVCAYAILSNHYHQGGTRSRMPLLEFMPSQKPTRAVIPFGLPEYLELVDWTGRRIVEGKIGAIDHAQVSSVETCAF